MRELGILAIHLIVTLVRLLAPGGARSIVAESLFLKQPLLIVNRGHRRARNLRPMDRLIAGSLALLLKPHRVARAAIVLRPSTVLNFHRLLVNRKYRRLFSPKRRGKQGPKGPAREVIAAIVEMKRRNPRWGCPRIAMQMSAAFGKRRRATMQDVPTQGDWQQITATSRRGFTGHEELDNVEAIHMNGRVYDPQLGRFMSADPMSIGNLAYPQSLNPYSYVSNSPLSATDPSGFEGEGVTFPIFVTTTDSALDQLQQDVNHLQQTVATCARKGSCENLGEPLDNLLSSVNGVIGAGNANIVLTRNEIELEELLRKQRELALEKFGEDAKASDQATKNLRNSIASRTLTLSWNSSGQVAGVDPDTGTLNTAANTAYNEWQDYADKQATAHANGDFNNEAFYEFHIWHGIWSFMRATVPGVDFNANELIPASASGGDYNRLPDGKWEEPLAPPYITPPAYTNPAGIDATPPQL
jgi:RHS repeat-associated protein